MTSGNWPDVSSVLAYAVRSWSGETSLFTLISGCLSVTRLIAASQYEGVRFGVSKTRNVISFDPGAGVVFLDVSDTEQALSVAAVITARPSAIVLLVRANPSPCTDGGPSLMPWIG